MIAAVQKNMDKIMDACNRHQVKALYLFGSAARQHDFTEKSDIDFLVEFAYSYDHADDDLIEQQVNNTDLFRSALEEITKREVDLLQEQNIRNKFLKYFINKDKKLIYGIS
jgi:uncharacterized protein